MVTLLVSLAGLLSPPPWGTDNRGLVEEPRATMVIPYVAGISEDIRRICRGHNIRVAFRLSRTLWAMQSCVKDKVPTEKQSGMVYKTPWSSAERCTLERPREDLRHG